MAENVIESNEHTATFSVLVQLMTPIATNSPLNNFILVGISHSFFSFTSTPSPALTNFTNFSTRFMLRYTIANMVKFTRSHINNCCKVENYHKFL